MRVEGGTPVQTRVALLTTLTAAMGFMFDV